MNTSHPALEKAGAFLQAHSLPGHGPQVQSTEGPFVTLSRESGAGATTLATALAERLGANGPAWQIYGANLITALLEANQLSPRLAQFLPERRVSETNALVGEIVGLHPNLWELTQKTNQLMCDLARKGNAIFIGRGAVFATVGVANGIHIRLIGSVEQRAKNTAARHGISLEAAVALNEKRDAERRGYVKRTFDANGPDPRFYDLVINTSTISIDDAVGFITTLVHSRTAAR